MESVTTPFGRRPMTLGMLAHQARAQAITPDKTADKWKLFRALCEARPKLGLTDRALALLNALLSFHPKAELSAADGLVVFPSNAQLSLRSNGMAEATIRRHLAALVEAGLISRKDSANGKRYARRDGEGTLNEAFGFSLAPLLARAEEIEAIAAAVVSERLALQRLKERLTIARRDAAKLIETALEEGVGGDWEALSLKLRTILAGLKRKPEPRDVAETLEAVEALRDEIAKRLENLANVPNISGNPVQIERHIQNSNTDSSAESEPLFEEEQGEKPAPERKGWREPPKTFPLALVLSACPDISDYGPGGRVQSWRDLMAAAVVVRATLGISPSAYQSACEVMGPENAAVAVACILERANEINSAGGYLRDLTRRAERDEFSIGPMLMAALRARGGVARRTG
jgi:replication initiation protein RepC